VFENGFLPSYVPAPVEPAPRGMIPLSPSLFVDTTSEFDSLKYQMYQSFADDRGDDSITIAEEWKPVGEERLKEEMDEINARAWFAKYRYFSPKFMQIVEELSDEMFKQSKTNYFLAYRRRKEAWDAAIEAGLPQPIVQELAQEAWFAGDPPVYRTPQELRFLMTRELLDNATCPTLEREVTPRYDEWGEYIDYSTPSPQQLVVNATEDLLNSVSNVTMKDVWNLYYQAYSQEDKDALKAEQASTPKIGDGVPLPESERNIKGTWKYKLCARGFDEVEYLSDFLANGGIDDVQDELVAKTVSDCGDGVFKDSEGARYVSLDSSKHSEVKLRAAAKSRHEEVDEWVEVGSEEQVMKLLGTMDAVWEGKRGGIKERDAKHAKARADAVKREEEREADEAKRINKKSRSMLVKCGGDGVRIVTGNRFVPSWLAPLVAKAAKKLKTPLREGIRIGTLLAVMGGFGYGVDRANLMLKGPRRTTPPPVRTTTGLPY